MKNQYVRTVCDVAANILGFNPTILPIERFNKTYRDYSSHHRNNIGVKTKDDILQWKWNMRVLKENGFE